MIGCFVGLSVLMSCNGSNMEQEPGETFEHIGYRLMEPDQVFELPDELEEVSGLEAFGEHQLLCNEDETGHLYLFDVEEGRVVHKWKWGKKGDYEGVALIGKTAYVLKSSGQLFEIRNFAGDGNNTATIRKLNSGLDKWCDAEALCQLPGTQSLLIACKEGDRERRTIYRFDTEMPESPASLFLEINLSEIEERLITTELDKISMSLHKLLDPQGSAGIFYPSGIAVHPVTQEIYILSAKSRLLVVYSQEGRLQEVEELRHERFIQPEAITFTPDANLFIGNEGGGGKANILKFTYVQP